MPAVKRQRLNADNSDFSDQDDLHLTSQAGLADVAKKILQPQLQKSVPILAKDKAVERKLEESKLESKRKRQAAAERRQIIEKGHVIPDHSTKNYERSLAKIGTRGVVRLFNTVRKQQKELNNQLADVPLGKRDKVAGTVLSKRNFLDMLKSGSDAVQGELAGTSTVAKNSSWLSSDFMMGAKMKDWDKLDANDDDDEAVDSQESDLDDEDEDDDE